MVICSTHNNYAVCVSNVHYRYLIGIEHNKMGGGNKLPFALSPSVGVERPDYRTHDPNQVYSHNCPGLTRILG